jgi:hypothetical protein
VLNTAEVRALRAAARRPDPADPPGG